MPPSRSHRSLWPLLFIIFALAGSASSCGSAQNSGESHFGPLKAFLRLCEDGFCENGDRCECGVCTVKCEAVGDCVDRIRGAQGSTEPAPENIRCRAPSCTAKDDTEGDQAGGSVCEVTCETDDDCSFLDTSSSEAGHVCVEGACRTQDPPETPVEIATPAPVCPEGRTLISGEKSPSGFAFCLDQTEVTVAAYRACVDASDCEAPSAGNFFTASREDHPIQFVDLSMAENFCAFSSGRLPTLEEWQSVAAGGSTQDSYPWGNAAPESGDMPKFVCALGIGDTCATSTYPAGDSSEGVSDLSGNVAELVAGPSETCAAGGNYDSSAAELQASSCPPFEAPSSTVGFRCLSPL